MRYAVETFTLVDGWVNCWTIDGQPETFETEQAAQQAIGEHLADCEECGIDCDDEFQIVQVN